MNKWIKVGLSATVSIMSLWCSFFVFSGLPLHAEPAEIATRLVGGAILLALAIGFTIKGVGDWEDV